MIRIIIDTNLWISFLIGHQTSFVRRMLTDLRFDVYVCDELLCEICDVAVRKKFSRYINSKDVDDLLTIISAFCHSAKIVKKALPEVIRDPKDVYLLSLAETIRADYIISGDADLTDLEEYGSTRIVKLSEFKKMMQL